MRSHGFTLLEVLIAITITAMIGVGATQLLSNILESRQLTEIRAEQLASLQRFNMVVGRDIEQIISRSVRDEYGDTKDALLVDSGEYLLEFTRAGWRNSPFAENPRSELQRVAYALMPLSSNECEQARIRLDSWGITHDKGECLVRLFWPVLDLSPMSKPMAQVVLEQVDSIEIDVLAGNLNNADTSNQTNQPVSTDNWFSAWPALDAQASLTPKAIRWRLTLPSLGNIERLWLTAWAVE